MKFILIIPVMLLFVGQVPWMKSMQQKMTEMNAMTAKKDCCSKKGEKKCHKEETQKKSKDDSCCNKTEARCACICCFSVAPITNISSSHKSFATELKNLSAEIDQHLLCQYYPVLTPPPDLMQII